jgi:L-threonylcarbamoyladenylate synthase
VKGRGRTAAIPLIAASAAQALDAAELGPAALRLAGAFWPGPLSIVVPARSCLAGAILGGGTTVAIRVPAHAVARTLADLHGFAITATSANRSGARPASSADEVRAALEPHVDVLVDGGATPGGLPSTIVELTDAGPVERRAGAIAWDRVLESLQ